MVPEPEDAKALIGEPPVAQMVARAFRMLAAISFNNQPVGETHEVGDIAIAEGNLSPPFQLGEAFGTKDLPQFLLGVGLR